MEPLIIVTLLVLLIVIFLLYLVEKSENRKLCKEYLWLKTDINQKYISKKDARLINAAQKAYETAVLEKSEFEIKEYWTLLKQVKGKG